MRSTNVTVVIPWSGNDSQALAKQLLLLANQTSNEPFEVVVACNSLSAQMHRPAVSTTNPKARFIDATENIGISFARNAGVSEAHGTKILFCDADDEVAENWVEMMSGMLDSHPAAGSVLDFVSLNGSGFQRQQKQSKIWPRKVAHYAPTVPGGSLAIRREVFESMSGFDPKYDGAEDLEFCFRLHKMGYALGLTARTEVRYRLKTSFISAFRAHLKYGRAYAKVLKAYSSVGAHHSPADFIFGLIKVALAIPLAIFSPRRRVNCGYILGHFVGRLRGSFVYRVWAM